MTWSTTSRLIILLFLTNSLVSLISATDGVGSPVGWLWTKIKLEADNLYAHLKIKFASMMLALLAVCLLYFVFIVVNYAKISFALTLPFIGIAVCILVLIDVYSKNLNKLKEDEKDLNNIEKKDI